MCQLKHGHDSIGVAFGAGQLLEFLLTEVTRQCPTSAASGEYNQADYKTSQYYRVYHTKQLDIVDYPLVCKGAMAVQMRVILFLVFMTGFQLATSNGQNSSEF